MPQKSTLTKQITRWRHFRPSPDEDVLTIEEPLEIRVGGQSLIVVMRTPGHDFDLATGFLYTEGLIASADEIGAIAYCEDVDPENRQNVINVHLTNGQRLEKQEGWQRNFHANASCGLCGKMTIESVKQEAPPITSQMQIDQDVFYQLNDRLRSAQVLFDATGGLHGAGLFSAQGELQIIREDIGRHNAVDKVIGQALLTEQIALDQHIMMVSGRASFEIVQKALFARIPVIVAVSAASSLAVELAQESEMTLIGFMRGKGMTVYSRPDRIR
ncbi:MAG: formate dehydrogenase accessory sulfurtransferase FdhD [Candidatus Poribacteria bacterium]|nr:formate dehydrogenase accessory sulfurtransferase FdhD [Candidatus Poribacteria bacterium]